jgi:hypothetical protein
VQPTCSVPFWPLERALSGRADPSERQFGTTVMAVVVAVDHGFVRHWKTVRTPGAGDSESEAGFTLNIEASLSNYPPLKVTAPPMGGYTILVTAEKTEHKFESRVTLKVSSNSHVHPKSRAVVPRARTGKPADS